MNPIRDAGASALANILEAWYGGQRIEAINLAEEYQRRFNNLVDFIPKEMKVFLTDK